MLGRVRQVLFSAITTPRGDSLAAVRVPKAVARQINLALGRPLAPPDELREREQARTLVQQLRSRGAKVKSAGLSSAPVCVYLEKDRNVRELTRVEELLRAKGIEWKRLDIAGDEATLDFVMRTARCERDELPVVFVAEKAVGRYPALVQSDVSGELAKLVSQGGG